jgi:glycosyltransferase involved in cell wall biosynthesis
MTFHKVKRRLKFEKDKLINSVLGRKKNLGLGQKKSLYFTDSNKAVYKIKRLNKGNYKLNITHSDYYLYTKSKLAIVNVFTDRRPITPYYAKKMNLNYNYMQRAYSYIGGGKKSKGLYSRDVNIEILEDNSTIYLEFIALVSRNINLDSISLQNTEKLGTAKQQVTDNDVYTYCGQNLVHNDNVLLYADINLNCIDGSSIWLTSMVNILGKSNHVLIFSKVNIKTEILISNICSNKGFTIISPESLGYGQNTEFTQEDSINLIRKIDFYTKSLRYIYVRGFNASKLLLSNRQFKDRAFIYLTDFYRINDGEIVFKDQKEVSQVLNSAYKIVLQTKKIGDSLRELSLIDFSDKCLYLPPAIPDDYQVVKNEIINEDNYIIIGYAGKITPDWGVSELVDWINKINKNNLLKQKIKLRIISHRISPTSYFSNTPSYFVENMTKKLNGVDITFIPGLNREDTIKKMADCDLIWCWRPDRLEHKTLELSTKLVEMVAQEKACICNKSDTNLELLGNDYPYFVNNMSELEQLLINLEEKKYDLSELAAKIYNKHSYNAIHDKISPYINSSPPKTEKLITFNGHDFKFIDSYISRLKSQGYNVLIDNWEWGTFANEKISKSIVNDAALLFCEWGLANAVWYSKNKRDDQKLYIRCHLQEINERARKFGHQINIENVDLIIFVSKYVRDEAVKIFNWNVEKTQIIPNYILDDEYNVNCRTSSNSIRLGMVGIIPQRKRFDRALNLLESLNEKNPVHELFIKGPRPEELDFMHGASRLQELNYYKEQYKRIDESPNLKDKVIFEGWGNDVPVWYKRIDYILSPSDFESFHYALADGVLSGCKPVIWDWNEANEIYSPEFVKNSYLKLPNISQDTIINFRASLVEKYGYKNIFTRIDNVLF